jgi:hypothetical protein
MKTGGEPITADGRVDLQKSTGGGARRITRRRILSAVGPPPL